MSQIIDFISAFVSNIRIADLIDVIIISGFLYTFISWLRRSASRRIMIALSIFVMVYVLSRLFELYLTEFVLKTLIVVVLIGIVVVFQADIRRLIDLIGSWGYYHPKRIKKNYDTIDVLVEAVTKMAERKTGALIAVKGRHPLDGTVTGGIDLNGRASIPLLFSIFNTTSPGHDGAVLIEGEKIVKFGAHLSLSTNLKELGSGGTRHAAGLGLSEQCDAFVIIVSEERGSITLARNGKFFRIKTGVELKNKLVEFWDQHYNTTENYITQWWKNKDLMTAVTSVSLAVLFWFLFAYQSETVFRTYTVPVEYRNLNASFRLKDPVPSEAKIILSGSQQSFRLLDDAALAVSIDLNEITKGSTSFMLTEENVDLPRNIDLYDIEPRTIKIQAQELKSAEVPVEARTSGRLPEGRKLAEIKITPSKLRLMMPENYTAPKRIYTEQIDLSRIRASSTVTVKLAPPPAGVHVAAGQPVQVSAEIIIE